MKVRDDLDASKMRKAGGRRREHTEEQLLEVLGNRALTTQDWQELAEEEHGISRRTFYTLKKALDKLRVLKSKTGGNWQSIKTK